jgi:hypothetical protein
LGLSFDHIAKDSKWDVLLPILGFNELDTQAILSLIEAKRDLDLTTITTTPLTTQASLKDSTLPLLQSTTLSPPSVPSEDKHASVDNVEVRNFGVMPLAEFEQIFHQFLRSWLDIKSDSFVHYASENDVANDVNGIVKDIASSFDPRNFHGG